MTEKKRKRGHNEGSIYQRASDGKWVGAISLGWENGKLKRKVVYGKTRADVSLKITRLLNDHQRGLPIQTSSTTVGQFLDDWLEQVVKPSVRPRTYTSYAMVTRVHLKPAIGRHRIEKLTQQHVLEMMNQRRRDGASARSVAYMRAILRQALNQAMSWDLVARNVAALVKPPPVTPYEAKALTGKEAARFLEAARGERLEALYGGAVSLGLRQSEAFGLRWQDVDLEHGRLTVRWQLQEIDGEYRFVEPKSSRSRRTVTLPAPLLNGLKQHRSRQNIERLQAGSKWKDWNLVFCTPLGTPLDGSNVRKQYKALLKRAGLPELRFHDLRHSAASLLAARGVSQRTVMEILGHSQISTTMNIYTHIETDTIREATDRMADLFPEEKASS